LFSARLVVSSLCLIFGTGPAACWTARHLRAKGLAVKAVNRSGQRPALMLADVAIIQADLSQERQAIDVTQGATVVDQALGPAG
jgi:prephenate dehydrogenase